MMNRGTHAYSGWSSSISISSAAFGKAVVMTPPQKCHHLRESQFAAIALWYVAERVYNLVLLPPV